MIVAGKKMHEREMKFTEEYQKLVSEEFYFFKCKWKSGIYNISISFWNYHTVYENCISVLKHIATYILS